MKVLRFGYNEHTHTFEYEYIVTEKVFLGIWHWPNRPTHIALYSPCERVYLSQGVWQVEYIGDYPLSCYGFFCFEKEKKS